MTFADKTATSFLSLISLFEAQRVHELPFLVCTDVREEQNSTAVLHDIANTRSKPD